MLNSLPTFSGWTGAGQSREYAYCQLAVMCSVRAGQEAGWRSGDNGTKFNPSIRVTDQQE